MSERKLPDYLLERVAQGELPEAKEQLDREPGGAARLEALRASDAELLAQHPPEIAASEIARRQRAVALQIRPRRMAWLAAPAGALAAALLVLVLRPEHTLVKGDPALLVYRNRGVQADLLQNGASVRAGEVVQLAYIRARPVYGVIVSLDGAGHVTLHLPDEDIEAVRLVADARTLLPHAYELDAAPKYERFFLVTSEETFVASVALEAARKLAARGDVARTEPLPLPPRLAQTSFLLVKQ